MAEITKVATASYCSVTPPQSGTIAGLLAGEDIGDCAACYIKASDGLVYLATGAANDLLANVAGFSFVRAYTGDAVTLVDEGNMRYAAALTPGALLYLSGTVPGGLADAASTGGLTPIAYAIDATRVRIRTAGIMA